MKLFFIGERPSQTAAVKLWSWTDGRLAAKQLFDALRACGIDPTDTERLRFANMWLRHDSLVPDVYLLDELRRSQRMGTDWTIVGMGATVQRELDAWQITHLKLIHPAARGAIRLKSAYCAHVAAVLKGATS